ncbi:MAG: CehA/McbA family metallohydrolase [Phycisphaeraceae bacterium]
MTTPQAPAVTYEGPTRFVATDRQRQPIRFIIQPGDDLPVATQLRLVMGWFRGMRDNNAHRGEQWNNFDATLESDKGGTIETLAGVPHEHHQMASARLRGELFNHYAIGLVEITDAVPAGATIELSVHALLSHQAPLDACTFVQLKRPDDEDFQTVGDVIKLENVPGPASGLEARAKSGPSDGVHAIHVFTHDDIDNPVEIGLPLCDLESEVLGPGEATADGVKPTGDDPVRVRVRQPSTGYESLTNPVQRATFHGRRVYFGGIHWHSRFSGDGDRPLQQGYAYARDTLGLDFAGVTDHTPKGFWKQTLAINEQFHEPGRFVTLPSWEWSTNTGHSNIYLRRPDAPGGPEHASTANHPGNAQWPDEAIVVPHHTNIRSAEHKPDGSHYWHEFDWSRPNRRVRLVELLQTRGNFEADTLDDDWGVVTSGIGASVRDALAMGHRIGFVGGTDNHTGFPTRDSEMGNGYIGMACVLAHELTRESIWDAMNDRRTYATSGKPIVCHWTVNGHEMGEEAKLQRDAVAFSATLHGTAPIERIEVISNGEVVWQSHPDAFDVTLTDESLPAPPAGNGTSAYYYLRLRQHDGHRAWLSPVWLDR